VVSRRYSPQCRIIGVDVSASNIEKLRLLGVADVAAIADCTSAPAMVKFVEEHLGGHSFILPSNSVFVLFIELLNAHSSSFNHSSQGGHHGCCL